jgi:hypothetical protein
MDMKKLIESMDHIEECGMTEMPAMPASLPAPEMDKGNPVTVNVSMNASGKEHVADLLDMMKNAGLGGAEPVSAKMLSPRMDMERLSAMMDEPEMEEIEEVEEEYTHDDFKKDRIAKVKSTGASGKVISRYRHDDGEIHYTLDHGGNKTSRHPASNLAVHKEEVEEGDYANEPDAQYGDMSDAIPDGNDLNRKKKAYAATQDGDNPMAVEAIKAALYAALTEKKAKPDFLDIDKDGDTKEPMKKAVKDKKEKEVGEGRGRGKKLMAGRGRGK